MYFQTASLLSRSPRTVLAMQERHPLDDFHPVLRDWFTHRFGTPTPPQTMGWPSIAAGRNTLILAPTGSGKTLAAFFWAINHVFEQHLGDTPRPGIRILYVSPLKALSNDIERNLSSPLREIEELSTLRGLAVPRIRAEVRTGDTPQARRAAMIKRPPDILITTPESLYVMLTARLARRMFETVQYVIVDEIHSLCGNKRGVHLSLSLERLQQLAAQEIIRIGLSATQRPLERIADYLGGRTWERERLVQRPVTIIDAGQRKEMDLRVQCPVPDFSLLPQEGVWPHLYAELLRLILRHRTTLIFVNNRRQAERIAAKLNEMLGDRDGPSATNLHAVPQRTAWSAHGHADAEPSTATSPPPPFLVQAYHGSMSRSARERMEGELKAGNLRALVATSSLELGIDIGSIDLVVQVQSPKGVARGLQRVGRSGHLITATSKGRILPTHREDLVEAAVVARAMMRHDVEATVIPENCLDVLAQQIVAMVSVEAWEVDALFDCVRRSSCYRSLPRNLYIGVLQMLAGRFTDEAFRELRARISWDKVNNILRPLPGSGQLAITSGGTISDRGYFSVTLGDGKTRVGEVDEEFVYETRVGDTFLLGTSVWRVASIDLNRLTVEAAPGQPARMPFWRGEGIGRSVELGMKVGSFRRELSDRLDAPDCLAWLQQEFPVDRATAWNIQEYFRKQREISGIIPHDQLLLVEGFRDEIGDPRLVVHSAFGRRVNGLLGFVLSRLLHESTGVEPQMYANDDGVLLRCSDVDRLPTDLLHRLSPDTAGRIVLEDLLASPLFGGQFRQNAARALLMPRRMPGKRTPLWLQRLRAGDLLQIARRHDDFPLVIETVREVLHDILDYDAFLSLVRGIHEGSIRVETVLTDVPSPFSASLLFDFIAVYMYEWDQPKADTLSQYLPVNRELLSEILDLDAVSGLIRPEAVDAVEGALQHTAEGYRVRSPEELMELLLRVGDLSEEEISVRCEGDARGMLEALATDGRAVRVPFPDGERWVAGEEREVYAHLHSEHHLRSVVRRYLQHHGPVTSGELAQRFGAAVDDVERTTSWIMQEGRFARGRFLPPSMPGADEPQWVYRPNMERIHRRTLSILRREITPCTLQEFTRFLLQWQHLLRGSHLSGNEGLIECVEQMEGLPLPADAWAQGIFPARVRGFEPGLLDHPSVQGVVVWVGRGSGKLMPVLRGSGGVYLEVQADGPADLSEPAKRIHTYLSNHGASFFGDLRSVLKLSLQALNNGISELLWNGLITNDVFGEMVKVKRTTPGDETLPSEPVRILVPQRNPARSRLMQGVRRALRQVPGWTGRWSIVQAPAVMGEPIPLQERAAEQAGQLLRRYGVVARELHRREELLPWSAIAHELQRMEMRGEIRRGYFIEGLAGMQFALPEAVEELRRSRGGAAGAEEIVLLSMCDPANPFGAGIDLPTRREGAEPLKAARVASAAIAFRDGTPLILAENHGARLWTMSDLSPATLVESVRTLMGRLRQPPGVRDMTLLRIERIDGMRPAGSTYEAALRSLGFRRDRDQTMTYDGYP